MQERVALEGILSRLKTRLFGNSQQAQSTVNEESLDVRLSRMPPQYQKIFVQVAATPRMLEQIDSQTRLILHHLHSIVADEKRGFCFFPEYQGLSYLVGYGLAELRSYEGSAEHKDMWASTKFVHPTEKGIQINDELEARGYDFAPPKGASYAL